MALMDSDLNGLRHPWLEDFQQAPLAAFSDLMSGYARVHPYDRADAPDAARMLFGPLPPEHPLRQSLDKAATAWLDQCRKGGLPADSRGLKRAIREICEVFEIVSILLLSRSALDLRRRFVVWNDWVGRLVLSPARDARLEYWRTLALTQPLVAATDHDVNANGLEPFWHLVCRNAGGDLRSRYLEIGLLGLRRLPRADMGEEVPWLAGLAHWALVQNPPEDDFRRDWLALKALYPRAPERWRKLVRELLSAESFRSADIEPPAWWRVDPDLTSTKGQAAAGDDSATAPTRSDALKLANTFDRPFSEIEQRIDHLMKGHRGYVHRTGDAYYLVRATHLLGQALIERPGNDLPGRARKAASLAREGLTWEPRNPFLWSLWRDALVTAGSFETAERVGWEFVRIDPRNVQAYVQLANLLGRHPDRRRDAENLYKQTINWFHENAYARTQLAELLILENRVPEALAVVDAAFAERAASTVSYALLARLQYHAGQFDLAEDTVHEALELDPDGEGLLDLRDRLEHGHPLPLKSGAFEPLPVLPVRSLEAETDWQADGAMRRGRIRRLRFNLETGADDAARTDALDELNQILREDPTFAYAELLATRQGVWQAESHGLPSFASGFEDALRTEDREGLERLAELQPRLKALILVGRAVLGDEAAAKEIEAWLQVEHVADEPAIRVLQTGLKPVLALIEGGLSAFEAFASRRQEVMAVLHDANEASLDSILIAG
jgi:tetratricopeptide (TPR) repeat protein